MTTELNYTLVKKFDIVKREVSMYYGISEWQLVHGGSFQKFVFARRIAMYICYKLFASRDETAIAFSSSYTNTAIGIREVKSLMATNSFGVPKIYGYLSGEVLRTMSVYRKRGLLT